MKRPLILSLAVGRVRQLGEGVKSPNFQTFLQTGGGGWVITVFAKIARIYFIRIVYSTNDLLKSCVSVYVVSTESDTHELLEMSR